MKLIVSVDKDWGIGNNGGLLMPIPEDMKFFRETTLHRTVIMGRKTFESLPLGQPLDNRRNIVLTTNENYNKNGIEICFSLEELFTKLADIPSDDVFVIGGETIYRQLIKYCHVAYVTKMRATFQAEQQMVNLDENESWNIVKKSPLREYKGILYQFLEYQRADEA
ncbi:MAG: dihydrofolate reductase [Clostridiales bacterium]|nr:dihydrofolate reductase [Clostridiales bacterium]